MGSVSPIRGRGALPARLSSLSWVGKHMQGLRSLRLLGQRLVSLCPLEEIGYAMDEVSGRRPSTSPGVEQRVSLERVMPRLGLFRVLLGFKVRTGDREDREGRDT